MLIIIAAIEYAIISMAIFRHQIPIVYSKSYFKGRTTVRSQNRLKDMVIVNNIAAKSSCTRKACQVSTCSNNILV